MNDVHNSHAFEFNYPQSMANCVTCHAGKLDLVLTDANFRPTVCKSCHPVAGPNPTNVTGGVEAGRAPSLQAIWAAKGIGVQQLHAQFDLYAATANGVDVDPKACNICHQGPGTVGKTFKQIHGGFSKAIYSAEGVRYADSIKVTVGATSFDAGTNLLTIPFSIAGTASGALVKPTVVVSLYGYGSKDFVVSGHGTASDGKRNLEFAYGASGNSARLTLVPDTATAGTTSFTATADLTTWASMISAGTVKRVQVNVLPAIGLDQTRAVDGSEYVLASGVPTGPNPAYNPAIAVAGASVAIDLPTGAVNAGAYGTAIVDARKCNACHDALGTTFHGPNYGSAGVVACRVCHFVGAGAYHLEMQSRSIDSFVHAIHSMQAMDIFNVDRTDPTAALRYGDHVEGNYPNFAGTLNCESCHNAGSYEVPDQTKSLPGILSASSAFKAGTRNIGTVAAQISGPAERACGGCHRAQLINEDDASSLAAFYAHTTMFGTSVTDTTVLTDVTAYLMGQVGAGPLTGAIAGAQVETCVVCHPTAGSDHQALFNTWKNGL
jgi:OmcA/MtrC family decaheme c-type cytochrome